ncbi:MAG: SpoIIE family protein phosphatase [Phycisphaera sp.]|nr:SpoIIE family protein phosphatase [Phycisphaera sp.]
MSEVANLQAHTDAPPLARLLITGPDGTSTEVPVQANRAVLGRSVKSDIQINSPNVSRQHIQLFQDPFGRWWVHDLDSRIGTSVNGLAIKEVTVGPNDVIEIGPFTITLAEAVEPEAEPEAEPDDIEFTAFIDSLPVDDKPGTQVSSLDTITGSKIELVHLATMKEFGDRLLHAPKAIERLNMLCRLLTRRDFYGQAAVALRLQRRDPRLRDPTPKQLCDPQLTTGQMKMPHISRGLLRAVFQSKLPAMATTGSGPDSIELSVVSTEAPFVAMACPISVGENRVDVLYATFPAEHATAEWLTLVALATQQFQQVEAMLKVQQQAGEQAKIEHDLNQAKQIQMQYVPESPTAEGLDIAIGFEPCLWVGGDYVDVVQAKDGTTILVVADVSGKGMPAALITSNVYTMVRASIRAGADLAALAVNLNEHLCELLREGRFVTMAAVAWNPQTGQLRCVNAGHPSPLIIRPNGTPRLLEGSPHLPLGIMPQEIPAVEATLEPGETLAMFTDGLTELTNLEGQMLGVGKLMDQIAAVCKASNDDPIDHAAAKLKKFLDETHGPRMLDDDRTFLLARRQT